MADQNEEAKQKPYSEERHPHIAMTSDNFNHFYQSVTLEKSGNSTKCSDLLGYVKWYDNIIKWHAADQIPKQLAIEVELAHHFKINFYGLFRPNCHLLPEIYIHQIDDQGNYIDYCEPTSHFPFSRY